MSVSIRTKKKYRNSHGILTTIQQYWQEIPHLRIMRWYYQGLNKIPCSTATPPEQHELVSRIVARMGLEGLEKPCHRRTERRTTATRALGTRLGFKPEVVILDRTQYLHWQTVWSQTLPLLEEINKERAIILVSHDIGTVLQNVKTIACVNETLDYHPIRKYPPNGWKSISDAPIELLGHGNFPHRILKCHHHDE